MKINSHNEWDKLREIIVGNAEAQAALIFSGASPLDEETKQKALKLAREAFPEWLIDEINEDLEGLSNVLQRHDVKVFRPKKSQTTHTIFTTPYFSASGEHCYNMRDLHLVVGNTVVESPSQERHRYFETLGLYDIWYEYFKQGFKWVCGPKPRLDEGFKIPFEENGKQYFKLSEEEILFEAANTVKMGKDLLYLVSRSGNYLGAKWLQSILGEDYRVHTTDKIYRSNHIDSTVLCLRPGLVLLCGQRVNVENCPEILGSWDKIYFHDIVPTPPETVEFHQTVRTRVHQELAAMGIENTANAISSDWIGMNILSINPETVIVDERQKPLIQVLEKHKLTVIPIKFRHSYFMGGIHCSTLDTVRESKLENYFD